jgi:hypothetical protein
MRQVRSRSGGRANAWSPGANIGAGRESEIADERWA